MADKELVWVGSARADLSVLPVDARRQLGLDLREVQRGRAARGWKPTIGAGAGAGAVESRVREADGAFRLNYVSKFAEAIHVLHAFHTETQKTSALDLELARSRYAAVRRQRQERYLLVILLQRGSGNVFADLGFPPEEAAHLLIRADLMGQLRALIAERGLTQKAATKALGVTQHRVSDLVRGRIELFSIDTLVEMLTRFGVAVTVKTKRRRRVA